MMNTKKFTLCAVAITMLLGGGITYARHHPVAGVDYPYDAGAYYNPTVADEADSPSTFALRDIAANGGTVYDYTRHIKSQIFGNDFINLANFSGLKFINSFLNYSKLSDAAVLDSKAKLESVNAITQQTAHMIITGSNNSFRQDDTNEFKSYMGKNFGYTEQSRYLSDEFKAITEGAAISLSAVGNDMDTIAAIADNSNKAIGEMQASQARNQLDALHTTLFLRRNALMANLVNMMSLEQQQKLDEEYHSADLHDQTRIGIVDPYNEQAYITAQKSNNYSRPQPIGMPNF